MRLRTGAVPGELRSVRPAAIQEPPLKLVQEGPSQAAPRPEPEDGPGEYERPAGTGDGATETADGGLCGADGEIQSENGPHGGTQFETD